ncbi:MAG: GAF domain-containing protein [Chitinispirillaceae bacterium]|nr:GAF domain-containing protein [Chitinispirillaceae bacterium]
MKSKKQSSESDQKPLDNSNEIRELRSTLKKLKESVADITERKRAEEYFHQRSGELTVLLKISQEFAATLDLRTILQMTTDRVVELTELENSAIYLLEEETLRLCATTPALPPQFPEELRKAPLADHPHIQKAFTTGQPVFLYDTATASLTPAERAVTVLRGLHSILYLPLITGTKVLGTLIVATSENPRMLSEEEIDLCLTFANLAAMAVENARLYASEQNKTRELEKSVTELQQAGEKILKANRIYSVISQINQMIVRTKDRDKIFAEACHIAVESGKFQMAWIGLVDEETKFVSPVSFSGIEDGYLTKIKKIYAFDVTEGQGPMGTAIREGVQNICNDIENDPRMAPWRKEALKRGYRSSIALPLKLFGKVIGAFCLYASTPHFFDQEEIDLLVEVTGDISFALEKIETERKLQKLSSRYEAILSSVPDIIMEVDNIKIYTWANSAGKEFFGEGVIGKEAAFYFEGEQETYNIVNPLFAGSENTIYIESWQRRQDGEKRLLAWWCRVLKDAEGIVTGALSTARDITELKQAEEALLSKTEELNKFFSTSLDLLCIADTDGYFHKLNPEWGKALGYTLQELEGKKFLDFIHPDDLEKTLVSISHLSAQENVIDFTNRYRCKDGTFRWIEWRSTSTGKLIFAAARDVTERMKAEEELKLYRENLERLVKQRTAELEIEKERALSADRLKSAFLATMSHELRTPLNSIIGFTGVLLKERPGPVNEEQKKQLGMVQNSARHLLSLINDVLDISKIEAGQLNINIERFNISPVINKVIENSRSFAVKKNLQINISVAPGVKNIYSDKLRVEQILLNLVNNAIKFTEAGYVSIECSLIRKFVIIKVIDTGIGIEKEQMEKIFKPFTQIDTGLTRKFEGTGLGLSICKKLLDLLNGSIEVESQPGVGSTFIVKLPSENGKQKNGT